jgi:16S rRNA (uracil1498-N3)-methyltransferase
MSHFFQENLLQDSFALSSEESKHITKSMRLKKGDFIWMTDGKGTLAKAVLTHTFKDNCVVEIVERILQTLDNQKKLHLAVAPTKNPARMEWLVEKAVELGVSQISFVVCNRSERKQVDLNRLHRIAIAALKQSHGTRLPELKTRPFSQFIHKNSASKAEKFIAYCGAQENAIEISNIKPQQDVIFLIGPEGDFTPQEVAAAQKIGFQQVTLGKKILRTETAGVLVVGWFFLEL